mmetsp:Transcript_904/g.1369  ORF Transcript_904/g.1369 Transcript_904/m.1369 type:complete len:419 (-) Transcript_904:140-1396(-)
MDVDTFDDDDDAPQLLLIPDEDDEAPQLLSIPDKNEDQEAPAEQDLPPCAVTILAGFLGSGKTTLIQYILRSPDHGKRIAVIENEFGGGNDGLSVESMIASDGNQSLTDLIELPNGCVCCTVKDDLVTTLESLLKKRQDLDHILIESSGMANPGPIASIFWLDDALESRLRLDGIVTLVDASNILQSLQETDEAAQQIAYADRIVMNKMDLADVEKQTKVLDSIRSIHPTAPIRKTEYAKIPDLEWILDSKSFADSDNAGSTLPTCIPIIPHKHTNDVRTISFSYGGSVDLKKLNAWFASLLWPDQDKEDKILRAQLESGSFRASASETRSTMQIFRAKGILSIKHHEVEEEDKLFVDKTGIDDRRFILQAVYDLWEAYPGSENLRWEEKDDRICKLIIIGRILDHDVLEQGFKSCFV